MSDAIPLTLTPEQERLALALSDMRQAAAAARLADQQLDHHARLALDTAISVSYARPWIDSNRAGKLKSKWLPPTGPDRDLHERLLNLRHKSYAHTDPAIAAMRLRISVPARFWESASSGFHSSATSFRPSLVYATARRLVSNRHSSTSSTPSETPP
jgi:hypothetical protein